MLAAGESKQPQATAQYLTEGLRALTEGDVYLAQSRLRTALKLAPQAAKQELVPHVGKLEQRKDPTPALQLALILQPYVKQEAHLLNSFGNLARRMGERAKAEAFYQDAFQADPDHHETLCNLAAVKAEMDLYGEAVTKRIQGLLGLREFLLPLYRLEADWPLRVKIRLVQEGKSTEPADLLAELQRLVQAEPDQPKHLYNQALHALSQRQGQVALAALETLEQQAVELPFLQSLIGLALYLSGDVRGAKELLQLQCEVNPLDQKSQINLGLMLVWDGDLVEGYFRLLLGQTLLSQQELLADSHKMLELAAQAYSQGDTKTALQYYNALRPEIDDPNLIERMADCYLKQGQPRASIECYERLLELPADHSAVKKRLEVLHEGLLKQGRSQLDHGAYQKAAELAELALLLHRDFKGLELAIWAYKGMNNPYKVTLLQEELEERKQREESTQKTAEAIELFHLGRDRFEKGQIEKAIQFLEESFRSLKTEECYRLLQHIYKEYRYPRALSDLVKSWQRHLETQERHAKWKKEALKTKIGLLDVAAAAPLAANS